MYLNLLTIPSNDQSESTWAPHDASDTQLHEDDPSAEILESVRLRQHQLYNNQNRFKIEVDLLIAEFARANTTVPESDSSDIEMLLDGSDGSVSSMSICDASDMLESAASSPSVEYGTSNVTSDTMLHDFIIGSDDMDLSPVSAPWDLPSYGHIGGAGDEPELPPLAAVHRFDPRCLRTIVHDTALFLIGAVEWKEPVYWSFGKGGKRLTFRKQWTLPPSMGASSLPRFDGDRLLMDVNWRRGSIDPLNNEFISMLVRCVKATQAASTVGVSDETIQSKAITYFKQMKRNHRQQYPGLYSKKNKENAPIGIF
ncbi:hypothetical protein HWV62_1021 [Athelia sp. TMB]|nr:hypothetical protein HWV62_1021 [Athelia sp. TMB]